MGSLVVPQIRGFADRIVPTLRLNGGDKKGNKMVSSTSAENLTLSPLRESSHTGQKQVPNCEGKFQVELFAVLHKRRDAKDENQVQRHGNDRYLCMVPVPSRDPIRVVEVFYPVF
jgi:hypothetical protein